MRVAYIHDWLVTYRGGEKVFNSLLKLYPDAPVFTLFYEPDEMPDSIRKRDIIFPRYLKPFKKRKNLVLPFLPAVMEALPTERYDLLISTSSCVAKGALPGPHTKHLCYLHSPMRYIWDQRQHYFPGPVRQHPLARLLYEVFAGRLRQWDVASANRVDRYIVNSHFVGARVQRYYGRDAKVIHPPIELERFLTTPKPTESAYFLAAGAFVPYKRFDLAIGACKAAGAKLVIAGSGPEEANLRRLAGGEVEFVVAPGPEKWQQLLAGARALLFPGVEDFGMIAIEAMASGTPVIALRAGGAMDFITPGKTGEFFDEPMITSLTSAIEKFSPADYDVGVLRQFASRFDEEHFLSAIRAEIKLLVEPKTDFVGK